MTVLELLIPEGIILLILIIVVYFKKRQQVGMTWSGPVLAKIKIAGQDLKCHVCGHEYFYKREALLNTTMIMFFHLGFFNKSAVCFRCQKCGYLHWFVSPKEKAEIDVKGTSRSEE